MIDWVTCRHLLVQQCISRKTNSVPQALSTKTLNIVFIKKKKRKWQFCRSTKTLYFCVWAFFYFSAIAGLSHNLTLSWSLRTRGINHTSFGHSWLGGSLLSFCPCLRAMSVNIYYSVKWGSARNITALTIFVVKLSLLTLNVSEHLDNFCLLSAVFLLEKSSVQPKTCSRWCYNAEEANKLKC